MRELEALGHAVVVYDALSYAGNESNLEGTRIQLRKADICDRDRVKVALDEFGIEAVVHMAADSHVQRSFGDFQRFIRTNVAGTETVLDACAAMGVRNVVHISTDEVFGYVTHGNWAYEDAPLRPRNPYSASKAAAEMVVRAYREYRGIQAKLVRLSNCYGPRQHIEKLVPRAIARISSGLPVELHGDGMQIRDWLHVEDAARGIAEVLLEGDPGGTYNLPGGQERSVAVVVGTIVREMGLGNVVMAPDRPGGNDRRYGMARSEARLTWRPLTKFLDGIRETVEWYRAHPERLNVELEAAA